LCDAAEVHRAGALLGAGSSLISYAMMEFAVLLAGLALSPLLGVPYALPLRLCSLFFSFAYPTYKSLIAIETPDGEDDKQWLTYFVVHSALLLAEHSVGRAIEFVPLYQEFRLLIILWLVNPKYNGATFLHNRYICHLARFLENTFGSSDAQSSDDKQMAGGAGEKQEANAIAREFVEEHGFDVYIKCLKLASDEFKRSQPHPQLAQQQ